MRRGFSIIQQYGILKTVLMSLFEVFYGARFAVRTVAENISVPCPYFFAHRIFKQLDVDYPTSVFVDFGSGLGRMLFFASQFPFRKVIGVEISENLCVKASENLMKYRRREKLTMTWDIVNRDASLYSVPADANVLFFSDPFGAETLELVVHNILLSAWRFPRRILIVYVNPGFPDVFLRHGFKVLKSEVNRHNKGYMIMCV